MTYLLLQTFLLLLASYFAGALTACLIKRAVGVRPALQPIPAIAGTARPQAAMPVPTPVRTSLSASNAAAAAAAAANATSRRVSVPSSVPAVAPRAVDPVQPKIDILARPEPKALPKLADTSRFDRALSGPDPNAGMPRRMIVEVRPAILPMVTGPAAPWPPPKKPEPVKPVEPKPVAPPPAAKVVQPQKPATASPAPQGSSAATAAAAAAAVAAAKAAAAAAAAVTPQLKTSSSAAADPVKSEPAKSLSSLGAILPRQAEPSPPPKAADVVEKPAAAVFPAPKPEPALTTVMVSGDDFQRIRAIDADTEKKLKAQGTRNFDDIGRWSAADVNRINQALGLDGRIDRDQWIEQAQILAKGGETYYSRNRAATLRSAAAGTTPKSVAPVDAATEASKEAQVQAVSVTPAPVAVQAAVPAPAPAPAAPPVRSVADMAAAAAAAIAAASASVTRGVRPIEPISPLSKVDPKIVIPARLSDAIKDKETKDAESRPPMADRSAKQEPSRSDDGVREGDDLKRIRGIGVLIEKRLNGMGISRYDQIANWTSGDIDRISQTLDFKGRIERENWVEHARILASGGHTEFSRRVDKGDVETSRDDDN
jgi:predicted flap endonuclease-1-like 5' DNA nuclease